MEPNDAVGLHVNAECDRYRKALEFVAGFPLPQDSTASAALEAAVNRAKEALGQDEPNTVCDECGSVVADAGLHEAWHEFQSRRGARL